MSGRKVLPQHQRGMTVGEYLQKQDILVNTPYVIKTNGHGFFIYKGREIPDREFRRMFALPFTLVRFNGDTADGRRTWLQA